MMGARESRRSDEAMCSGAGETADTSAADERKVDSSTQRGKPSVEPGGAVTATLRSCHGVDVDLDSVTTTQCEVPSTHPPEGKVAFVIEHAFSKQECDAMIRETEALGYVEALVNVGGGRQERMDDVRNCKRCMVDDEKAAAWIWQRIERFIPKEYKGRVVAGLNERLRFLKYDQHEYFKPHYDGVYVRSRGPRMGECSQLTFLLYLNEEYEGGCTTFLGGNVLYPESGERCPVKPTTGSVLVTQHDILHEGAELKSGRKYALRTDIMYHPTAWEARRMGKTVPVVAAAQDSPAHSDADHSGADDDAH